MSDLFLNPLDTAPNRVSRSITTSPSTQTAQRERAPRPFQDFLPQEPKQQPTPLIGAGALKEAKPIAKPSDVPPAKTTFPASDIPTADPESNFFTTYKDTKAEVAMVVEQPRPVEADVVRNATVQVKPYEFTLADAAPVVEKPVSSVIPDVVAMKPEVSAQPLPMLEQENITIDPFPQDLSYTIKKGDTLSHIVATTLQDQGIDYSTRELYNTVKTVADANGLRNANFIMVGQTIDLSSIASTMVAQKSESSKQISYADGVNPPVQGRITSHFGNRIHPILGHEHHHNGVDIAAPTGTPVSAVKPGVVTFSGTAGGYGQMVEIDHQDGTQSRYAHLSELKVNQGDRVTSADSIGAVGSTGRSTGPHLHLEIHKDGTPVNPLGLIPEPMIAMQ